MMLHRAIVSTIGSYLGFDSKPEVRFSMISRSTYFLMALVKTRMEHERAELERQRNEKKSKDKNTVTGNQISSLLQKANSLVKIRPPLPKKRMLESAPVKGPAAKPVETAEERIARLQALEKQAAVAKALA